MYPYTDHIFYFWRIAILYIYKLPLYGDHINKPCGAPLENIFIILSYDVYMYIKHWSFHNTFY